MDLAIVLEVIAVVAAWGVLGLTIKRWGPGHAKRRVHCPEWKVRAKVGVEQGEGDFGRLRVADVTTCSLFPGAALTCDKECLRQL
jgi:hypothetical protein